MKTRTLLPTFLVLVLATALAGQQPATDKKPTTPTGPTVDQLVEQLGDSDFRKRDKAANLIKAEGIKTLPALRLALKNPDAEVRRRALDLIPAIETEAILAPKRVNLKAKDKTLNEIFAELTKQTDYKYEFYTNDQNLKYTFDLNNLTFWEAMDQISKQTHMVLQQGYGDDRVRFNWQEGGGTAHYSSTDGSFRFTATSFQMYKHVDLMQTGRNANRSESLTLTFAVQSEPKLPLLGIGEPHLTAAFNNEKSSMLLPSNPNQFNDWDGRHGRYVSRYGNGNKMYYQQTQVNLTRGSEKATSVKLVRGTVPVTLLSEQKPHVIAENLLQAKGKKATIGTTTVIVEEASEVKNANPQQYTVKITFNEDTGGNQNDYSWQNAIYQRLELVDAKGGKFQIYGQNWNQNSATSVQMTLTYGAMDPNKKVEGPIKIIFYEWKVMQHQLNFEFKDLPLP